MCIRDSTYVVQDSAAIVTINRPERYNAFRAQTVEELIKAFRLAWADRQVQSVILTGAGDKAFCTGGDVKQRAETGDYGPSESGMFEIGALHKVIPVSYTHLDVYKRQGSFRATPGPCCVGRVPSWVWLPSRRSPARPATNSRSPTGCGRRSGPCNSSAGTAPTRARRCLVTPPPATWSPQSLSLIHI